jgi:hypothetical protein
VLRPNQFGGAGLVDAVELRRVVPQELAAHLGRRFAQAGLDLLLHGVAVEARGVREVGLEEDVVDGDLVEQAPGRDRLEPVAGVDLAGEVLRRQQLPLARAIVAALEVGVVDRLEHERDPADAALHRHHLQLREAGQHAAAEQVGHLQAVLQEELGRGVGVGRRGAVGGDPLGGERGGGVAAAQVEVHGHAGVDGRGPEAVPVGVAEVGQPEAPRLAGEQQPPMAGARAALDLRDRGVEVPERGGHHGDEPVRVGRRPVAQEVVVGPDAHQLELVVLQPQEPLAAEAGHVGVEHLGPQPDLVHVGQPGVGVVGRGVAVLVGPRPVREGLAPSGGGGGADLVEGLTLEEPLVLAGGGALHLGHVVDVLRRHP